MVSSRLLHMAIIVMLFDSTKADWLFNVKAFVSNATRTFQKELEAKLKDAHVIVEKSRGMLDDLTKVLKSEGRKLTATALDTAESTLKGAGDEVEDFFSEVPNTVAEKVNTGFQDLLTKADEGFTWFLWNVIVPVVIFVIIAAIIYLCIVSGCCACCCAPLLAQCGEALRKQLWKGDDVKMLNGQRVIVLRDVDLSKPLQAV
ncbi:hypothetical protein Tcan_18585 [Toxocara canis]|uniref:Uncharacterized protein n=1 Tax=Toxocara canis TaxID=6265 RepID=A0A0B2VHI1_TOXCA|nr:hypothetical protein Tcan_18585 [Toxocara canis]